MLKISLYRIFCIDLRKLINPYSYRKNQSYRIDGRATSAIGERFPTGNSHAYHMRCRAILLKSHGLKSEDIGTQTEMTHISVNAWIKRFKAEGITSLETRPGHGCKPMMDRSDEEAVRRAIEQDRQSVKKAKES